MTMPETRESREVAICRHEFAPMLDGECCMVRIGHEFPARLRLAAKIDEDFPARLSMREGTGIGPPSQALDEREGIGCFRWLLPDPRVGDDAYESARSKLR